MESNLPHLQRGGVVSVLETNVYKLTVLPPYKTGAFQSDEAARVIATPSQAGGAGEPVFHATHMFWRQQTL